jgi:hypothetical protein
MDIRMKDTKEDSLKKYIDAAQTHGEAMERGDYVISNKAHDQLMSALKNIRGESDQGESGLLKLLEHPNSAVVCWAATHLLPLNEATAKSKLQSLADNEAGLFSFEAGMVLQEWASGRLKKI